MFWYLTRCKFSPSANLIWIFPSYCFSVWTLKLVYMMKIIIGVSFYFWISFTFFFFSSPFRATGVAYGSFQAGSPTPQLTGNAGSLTYWVGPGVKPTSSRMDTSWVSFHCAMMGTPSGLVISLMMLNHALWEHGYVFVYMS